MIKIAFNPTCYGCRLDRGLNVEGTPKDSLCRAHERRWLIELRAHAIKQQLMIEALIGAMPKFLQRWYTARVIQKLGVEARKKGDEATAQAAEAAGKLALAKPAKVAGKPNRRGKPA